MRPLLLIATGLAAGQTLSTPAPISSCAGARVYVPPSAVAPRPFTTFDPTSCRAATTGVVDGVNVTDEACRSWCGSLHGAYCGADFSDNFLSQAHHKMCRWDGQPSVCLVPDPSDCFETQYGNGCFDMVQAWLADKCAVGTCLSEDDAGGVIVVDCFLREGEWPPVEPPPVPPPDPTTTTTTDTMTTMTTAATSTTTTTTATTTTTTRPFFTTAAQTIGSDTAAIGGVIGAAVGGTVAGCMQCNSMNLLMVADVCRHSFLLDTVGEADEIAMARDTVRQRQQVDDIRGSVRRIVNEGVDNV